MVCELMIRWLFSDKSSSAAAKIKKPFLPLQMPRFHFYSAVIPAPKWKVNWRDAFLIKISHWCVGYPVNQRPGFFFIFLFFFSTARNWERVKLKRPDSTMAMNGYTPWWWAGTHRGPERPARPGLFRDRDGLIEVALGALRKEFSLSG